MELVFICEIRKSMMENVENYIVAQNVTLLALLAQGNRFQHDFFPSRTFQISDRSVLSPSLCMQLELLISL